MTQRFPSPPASAGLVFTDGYGGLTEAAFLQDFANGVEPAKARTLYAVQGRVSQKLFADRVAEAAWRAKPCWYAVCTQDRTTAPELERFLAQRMDAVTVEIDSGHLSMITHPDAVTELILEATRTLQSSFTVKLP